MKTRFLMTLLGLFFLTFFVGAVSAEDEPTTADKVEKSLEKNEKWTKRKLEKLQKETEEVLDQVEKKMKKTKKEIEPEVEEMLDEVEKKIQALRKELGTR